MKLTIKLLAIALISVFASSCYEDYKSDYDYSATYFSLQTPYVTLLEDEDSDYLDLDAGVCLGGIYTNDKNWNVYYTVDAGLLDDYAEDIESAGESFSVLPSSYYTVSNSDTMVVPSGDIVGRVTFSIDKDKFMSDPAALLGEYVLPLQITGSDMDSINEGMDYTIIKISYMNQYHGYYYLTGTDTNLDTGVVTVYKEADDEFVDNKRMELRTTSATTVSVPYAGLYETASMNFEISGTNVTVSAADGSFSDLTGSGTYGYDSTLDRKTITVNYTFTDSNGYKHSVSDILYFSNVSNEDQRVDSWL